MCHGLGDGRGEIALGFQVLLRQQRRDSPTLHVNPGQLRVGSVRTRASLLALEWKGRQELKVQGQGGWDGQN